MIVTVLWEDQRGVEMRGFGPHDLLIACIADDLGIDRERLRDRVSSVPKKGVGNVRTALRKDIRRLANSGPVLAVIDRDKVINLWKHGRRPSDCMSGITARFREDAAGDYDLIFLVRNMETLVEAACQAMRLDTRSRKPTPDQRDRLLGRAASRGEAPQVRATIRRDCPSFDRIVTRVARALAPSNSRR